MSAAHQSITYNIRKILILLVNFLKITLIKIARNFSRYQIWMTWLINHLKSSSLTRLRLELTWSNLKLNRLPIYLTYRIPKLNNCAHLIFHKNTTYGKLSKTYKYMERNNILVTATYLYCSFFPVAKHKTVESEK